MATGSRTDVLDCKSRGTTRKYRPFSAVGGRGLGQGPKGLIFGWNLGGWRGGGSEFCFRTTTPH